MGGIKWTELNGIAAAVNGKLKCHVISPQIAVSQLGMSRLTGVYDYNVSDKFIVRIYTHYYCILWDKLLNFSSN